MSKRKKNKKRSKKIKRKLISKIKKRKISKLSNAEKELIINEDYRKLSANKICSN